MKCISHCHSYFIRGSDTDDVSRDRISDKRNFKMRWVVPDNLFCICPYGKLAERMKGPPNDSLKRKHFVLNCWAVIWNFISSVQHYRWRCTTPWKWLEEMKQRKSGETKTLSVSPESTHTIQASS